MSVISTKRKDWNQPAESSHKGMCHMTLINSLNVVY